MTDFGDFNLYEELEIIKESTPEEIKKAYKKLAMVYDILFTIKIEMASR
jgi:DnaJ-class molecular chaperone